MGKVGGTVEVVDVVVVLHSSSLSSLGTKKYKNSYSSHHIIDNFPIFDAIHNFSVWQRTGSYPVDINRFRSHTGKLIQVSILMILDVFTVSQIQGF